MGNTKNNLISFKALDAVSLTADRASVTTNIALMDNISVHIKCGAGATGEFFVQGSNVSDYNGVHNYGPGPSDWVTIPFVDSSGSAVTFAVSGSATDFLANAQGLAFTYLRVIYTYTSGSGTATAYVTGKSI